jgi:hypothetical protein
MRLCCGLMDGLMWEAALAPAEGGIEGNPVVVLSNDEVLYPADADLGEFSIVEATQAERETLKRAGYSMPDWNPMQGLGCAGCHTDEPQDEGSSRGNAEREA